MSRWSGWKGLALVIVVCGGHLALLAGFSHSFASGKPAKTTRNATGNFVINLRPTIGKPLAEALAKPPEQTSKTDSKVATALSTAQNQKIDLHETPLWPSFQSKDDFLDADAVDKTAEPSDNFEALLAQLLPLDIQNVVIEFWIEKDGRTVDVRCLEGACTDDVIASLPKLAELVFKPAIKNGEAVANRKVIQIDLKPSPGL